MKACINTLPAHRAPLETYFFFPPLGPHYTLAEHVLLLLPLDLQHISQARWRKHK